MIAAIPDQALITINSLEILGIIYLAIAVSNLRATVSHLQGRIEQREHDEDTQK